MSCLSKLGMFCFLPIISCVCEYTLVNEKSKWDWKGGTKTLKNTKIYTCKGHGWSGENHRGLKNTTLIGSEIPLTVLMSYSGLWNSLESSSLRTTFINHEGDKINISWVFIARMALETEPSLFSFFQFVFCYYSGPWFLTVTAKIQVFHVQLHILKISYLTYKNYV